MKKSLIIGIILTVLTGGALLMWKVQAEKSKTAKFEAETLRGLTSEQLELMLKSEAIGNPQGMKLLKESAEKRQIFLKGMHEYLALAAQARRDGFTEDANYKTNVEYKKDILLADLYRAKLSEGSSVSYIVPPEDVKSVLNNPDNNKKMEDLFKLFRDIQQESLKARGNDTQVSELEGKSAVKARENWAKTKILSDRAKADSEFMQRPDISLRLKIVEAGILASDYMRAHQAEEITATSEEIADYLKNHTEYNLDAKRQKAETVLQRVKNGEDFAKLAKEFSEDRSTKNDGGLYKDAEQNTLWTEIEQAAQTLEKGQIADTLIETHSGFHIIKLEDKKIEKDKTVKLSVRHIMFQNKFEEPHIIDPDIPPPFMNAEEIAKAEVEKEKRQRFIEGIIQRNEITLPEDFTVEFQGK